MSATAGAPRLTYVIGTYPQPTTSFIDREIRALRRSGVAIDLVSIRRPTHPLSPEQEAMRSDVRYVLPVRPASALRHHVWFALRRPRAYVSTIAYLLSRPHPSTRARARSLLHFAVGVHVAGLVRERLHPDHVHAHFVDRAAVVALVTGRLLGIPFSATAHANDIYVAPTLLPEKIRNAKFIATCTRYNQRHLASLVEPAHRDRIRCIYHGLELPSSPARSPRERPLVLSVAQLKEKKGLAHLIEASAILRDRGIAFDCEIVGEGPLRERLSAAIDDHGLGERVRLVGALPNDAVMRRYAEATVFALPCVEGADGDRDGIPNVILEAMAMELPVVSTRHSGIPEAVDDGCTGILVEPGDPIALADAIERLLADDVLRTRMGRDARRRVGELFDADTNARKLLEGFVA
jgi:colanic acid/amylovoran biosynthesis glycosyltransferase